MSESSFMSNNAMRFIIFASVFILLHFASHTTTQQNDVVSVIFSTYLGIFPFTVGFSVLLVRTRFRLVFQMLEQAKRTSGKTMTRLSVSVKKLAFHLI